MVFESEMPLIHFDRFDAADIVDSLDPATSMRRFGTLLVERAQNQGINRPHHVYRVRNTAGEVFILKTLQPLDLAGNDEIDSQLTPVMQQAFLEEYRNTAAVSAIKGFPSVYGYGLINGCPAFLMELIDGVSLVQAETSQFNRLSHACVVAHLGLAVLDVLDRTDNLDTPFVHRDISPSNIILRTSHLSLDEQIDQQSFDLHLIDLGSASSIGTVAQSFTMQFNLLRNGTPSYAAPEMLTNDISGVELMRNSPSIDIYALCSVLYELYSGTTPYAGLLLNSVSPYRMKIDHAPEPLQPRKPEDAPLVAAIMAGIHANQDDRIGRAELRSCLTSWLEGRPVEIPGRTTDATDDSEAVKVQEDAPTAPDTADTTVETEATLPHWHKPISRRTVLAAAGVALVGAGIATRGFGIIDRMNGIKGSLSEYSWDELADIALSISDAASDEDALEIAIRHHLIAADGTMANGGTKEILLADGTSSAARIIGLRHDKAADKNGLCGLSFLFDAPIAARPMNERPVSTGGWKTSGTRTWLNEDMLGRLPEELAVCIRPAAKKTNNAGGTKTADSVTETSDRLWLPSYVELVGNRTSRSFSAGYGFLADILNAEGAQYQLYQELDIQWTAANESLKRTFDDEPCYWWLRTPSPDVSLDSGTVFFNRVGPDGDPFRYATDSAGLETTSDEGKPGINTLMPGFCL